jgi:hypothetical protein
MAGANVVPNGNDEIAPEIPLFVKIIARTARWVNPQTFRELPVWYPWHARKRSLYDKTWQRSLTNTRRDTGAKSERFEANVSAAKALIAALGVASPKPRNWTVCHIWGYDDERFGSEATIVRNPRYYSCVANMVWLPTALKSLTDSSPQIKNMLRTCAFHLYGWACEDESVRNEAESIRSGLTPEGYPECWPSAERPGLSPPGTAPFTPAIMDEIRRRKTKILAMLADEGIPGLHREEVDDVLKYWNVSLGLFPADTWE